MVPFPFSVGPSDDWDPQGYEEEEEDTLAPGMHVLDDDEEETGDEAAVEEEAEVLGPDTDEEDDEEEEAEDEMGLEDLDKDPIEELDELENRVLETERATLRLSDFSDDE